MPITIKKSTFLGYPYYKIGKWGVIRGIPGRKWGTPRLSIVSYNNMFMYVATDGYSDLMYLISYVTPRDINLKSKISARKAIGILVNDDPNLYGFTTDNKTDFPERLLPKEVIACLLIEDP